MLTVDRCVQEKKHYKFSNRNCSRKDNGSVSKIPFTKQNKSFNDESNFNEKNV